VLQSYLSNVNAQTTLDRALSRIDLRERSFEDHHIAAVIPHLERSLKLFVDRARLPTLLSELHAQADTLPRIEPRIIVIGSEDDLSEARVQARQVCQNLAVPSLMRQKVVTLVSELARNIVLYAQRGQLELAPHLQPQKRIIVRATDNGPGIANLQQILAGQYVSKTGMGMGLRGCKRLANRFDIDTDNTGTRIEAEIQV
jgi:serine/threonine-protein kinase RsbT